MSTTYTMREAAQILGVTSRTVQRWRAARYSHEPCCIAPLTLTDLAHLVEDHIRLLALQPNPSTLLNTLLARLALMSESHERHGEERRQQVKHTLSIVR